MNKSKQVSVGTTLAQKSIIRKISKQKYLLLMLAPAVILTIIFSYLPMSGLIMAFQDYDIIKGIAGSKFVGLDNFVKIFTLPKFVGAIKNTLIFSSVNLFFGTPFPIILAILFNELKSNSLKKLTQTITYLPHFLSWISVIGMVYSIFSIDGAFNNIMVKLFGDDYVRTNILMKSENFLPVIFWSNLWKNVGWASVIYLAAISGIDQSLYEAATVDGCSKLKQVWYVTLPCLLPTIAIVFIMDTAGLVTSNFEQVYGFQNVYIQEETEVINTLVYRQGILNAEYSLSTAFGFAQGLVSFLLVFISNKIVKTTTGVGIW